MTIENVPHLIWGLKVPVELRGLLKAHFPAAEIIFPSVAQEGVGVGAHPPNALIQRILQKGSGAMVLCWEDISLTEEQKAQLDQAGISSAQAGAAHLSGPMPQAANRPQPYGIRLIGAPGLLPASPSRETVAAMVADYAATELTANNEGGLGAPLPPIFEAMPEKSAVFIVAREDTAHSAAPTLADRIGDMHRLAQRVRREHPNKFVVFLTNGQTYPEQAEASIRADLGGILANVDFVCSERWCAAYLHFVDTLYTLDASAAFDAVLAGKTVVVLDAGPLQDLAERRIDAETAFQRHFVADTLFGDPLHSVVIDTDKIVGVIAARRTVVPHAALSSTQRWPKSKSTRMPNASEDGSSFELQSANLTGFNPAKVMPQPRNFKPPEWLLAEMPAASKDPICLEGEITAIAALPKALAAHGRALNPIRLHPEGDCEALADFALYQPELCLGALIARIRASGAQKAVISDLDQPLVRLFARACAIVGVERLYIPKGAKASIAAASLTSLCDKMMAWTPEHSAAAREAEVKPQDISLIRFPTAEPAAYGKSIALWLVDTSLNRDGLERIVSEALSACLFVGAKLHLVMDGATAALMSLKFFDALIIDPQVRYTILETTNGDLAALLTHDHMMIGTQAGTADCAAQLGVVSRLLVTTDEIGKVCEKLSTLFNESFSLGTAQPALAQQALPQGMMSFDDAIGAWLQGQIATRRPGTLPDSIPIAISAVTPAALSREMSYVATIFGIKKHLSVLEATSSSNLIDADLMLQWGTKETPRRSRVIQNARDLKLTTVTLEDGFVRSIGIGLSREPGLSVYFDDLGAFYDATRPSRLELDINENRPLSAAEEDRAARLIEQIVTRKITKYNFAPYRRIERKDPTRPAILIVDQRGGDVSIEQGLATEATFAEMVKEALSFSATHDILIKTHPDANIGGRASAIGAKVLKEAAKNPAVTLVTEDMNPYSLIDIAEKVFVVSSGMGFEALLAGREVWCFGMPFYAGWGLTKDKIKVARRTAKPTLLQVFHQFYIEHCRYYDPNTQQRGEIEAVLDHIALRRPWSLEDAQNQPYQLNTAKMSESARVGDHAVLAESSTLWLFGFTKWKHGLYQTLFTGATVKYSGSVRDFQAILKSPKPAIIVWGYNDPPGLAAFSESHNIPLLRIEDGFLRSVGLGADHIPPNSACIDAGGLYYNSRATSDLERLLQASSFDAPMLARAESLRTKIIETGLSKYNFPLPPKPMPYGPKKGKRILVIGQVEDDASIRFGASKPITNNDLVRQARAENPDAQIIYRIHPDVLAARRPELSDPADVADICEISAERLSLAEAFDGVDHVYTITSLAGFEALMRGIKVTCMGMPFYAGWGLTDDRDSSETRTRKLSLDEVFAGAYIQYARYFDPKTGKPMEIEAVIDVLVRDLDIQRLAAL